MLELVSLGYQMAQIKMLLAASRKAPCLLISDFDVEYHGSSVRLIRISESEYDSCLSAMYSDSDLELKMVDAFLPSSIRQCLVQQAYKDVEVEPAMSAADFLALKRRVNYLNVSEFNVELREFSRATNLAFVRHLDLSRLQMNDSMIIEILESGFLNSLRYLNLSGNGGVTVKGVRAICQAVEKGRLSNLDGLGLLGTSHDASPYIDGHCWRISDFAKELAKEYGFQRWMMLGSKVPELSNCELLTAEQRDPFA